MAISHELSNEIAVALFSAKERSPQELNDLKDMVFKIHSTLEQLTKDAHLARLAGSNRKSLSMRAPKDG
ncbi:MAG: hypothetical protein AABN95_14090 [Acidobacteriota bacterium]